MKQLYLQFKLHPPKQALYLYNVTSIVTFTKYNDIFYHVVLICPAKEHAEPQLPYRDLLILTCLQFKHFSKQFCRCLKLRSRQVKNCIIVKD